MKFRLIFILALVGLVVLFIMQNVAVVELRFLVWSISMSRSLLTFLLLAVGFIVGWFLHGYMGHKKGQG